MCTILHCSHRVFCVSYKTLQPQSILCTILHCGHRVSCALYYTAATGYPVCLTGHCGHRVFCALYSTLRPQGILCTILYAAATEHYVCLTGVISSTIWFTLIWKTSDTFSPALHTHREHNVKYIYTVTTAASTIIQHTAQNT